MPQKRGRAKYWTRPKLCFQMAFTADTLFPCVRYCSAEVYLARHAHVPRLPGCQAMHYLPCLASLPTMAPYIVSIHDFHLMAVYRRVLCRHHSCRRFPKVEMSVRVFAFDQHRAFPQRSLLMEKSRSDSATAVPVKLFPPMYSPTASHLASYSGWQDQSVGAQHLCSGLPSSA